MYIVRRNILNAGISFTKKKLEGRKRRGMEKKWNDSLINNEHWDHDFFSLNAMNIMLNLLHFLIVHVCGSEREI